MTASTSKGEDVARRVRWVSGAASAVAAMLDWREHPHGVFATCETRSEDSDNERFLADIEKWLGQSVIRLRSDDYSDTWDVWERRRFMAGPKGAPCTGLLKVEPRLAFQRPDDIQIFGYTSDAHDVVRANRFKEHFFEVTVVCPLIERDINKAACLAILMKAGIQPARTYAEGFPNANCMPCSKATVKLTRINNVRIFIDEIPADWPTTNPIAPACDFMCHLTTEELSP